MDDVQGISRVLGVPPLYSLDRGDLVTFRLRNPGLGIRLKLEMKPSLSWARMHVDMDRRPLPNHIGVVELNEVDGVSLDFQRGSVRIFTDTLELCITATGTFSVRS